MHALLLIAHGSRRAEANADLDHVAAEMRARGRFGFVQCSYLELTEPGILAGGELCVAAGATSVVMLPYFLSPGVHVREDLTEARDELAAKFPDVRFALAEPLGRHPLLIEVVEQRAGEGIPGLPPWATAAGRSAAEPPLVSCVPEGPPDVAQGGSPGSENGT